MPQEKTTKKKLLEKLYSLSHDVIWEIEASREIEGKSFIKPSDLKRITELIDNISNDVEKTISQTREETIKELIGMCVNFDDYHNDQIITKEMLEDKLKSLINK